MNKSGDESDLETPVQAPTPGQGRKRAAGIFKATPVELHKVLNPSTLIKI